MTTVISGDASADFQTPLPVTEGGTGASTAAGAAAAIAPLQLGTAQNTTSGTTVSFPGIPPGVKRISIMFVGVSTTGTSGVFVQIGSGSYVASGYRGLAFGSTDVPAAVYTSSTSGFPLGTLNASTDSLSGVLILTLQTANTWIATGSSNRTAGTNVGFSLSGHLALSGTLDRLLIGSINGTDTFDAGSVNIMWEF